MAEASVTPSLYLKVGDTYPYLLGTASKKSGLVNLSTAAKLEVVLTCTEAAKRITGLAEYIQPPVEDEEGVERNWQYKWAANDTATAGLYKVELKVYWSEITSPKQLEIYPNQGVTYVMIEAAQ